MKIRYAEQTDIPELKNLWKVCFGDSDKYIDNFFDCLFAVKNTIIAEIKKRVAGVVYMIPAKLKETNFMYGYAIGVLPEFRGQSICKKMLDFIKEIADKEKFIFGLHPANEKLEQFYQKIGLKPMYSLKEVTLDASFNDAECEFSDVSCEEVVNMRKNTFSELVEWDKSVIHFIITNGGCVKKITLQHKDAYFFVRKEADNIVVYETSADDEFIKKASPCIKEKFKAKNIKYILSSKTTLQGIKKPYIYGFSDKDDDVYMNLFLD